MPSHEPAEGGSVEKNEEHDHAAHHWDPMIIGSPFLRDADELNGKRINADSSALHAGASGGRRLGIVGNVIAAPPRIS
jgi:hypothetical protein